MKSNEPVWNKKSRWVLYHGTSTTRLKSIINEDRLRISIPGDPKVSFTTERTVAEYWACHAVFGDRSARDMESSGVVLVLDGEKLLARGYDLEKFGTTSGAKESATGKTRLRAGGIFSHSESS